ncbi:hypothetical protein GGI12_003944 [Dipsacomyces acuminosporus]|nr:hypothetical protein GGI12_003944 [Dipsacomyces acuminosporus]
MADQALDQNPPQAAEPAPGAPDQNRPPTTPSRRTTGSSSSANTRSDGPAGNGRNSHRTGSARSSLYDAFAGMGGEPGKSPFALPSGDKDAAAAYLAQCYEQMMKDTASIHTSSAQPPPGGFVAAKSPTALNTSMSKLVIGGEIDEPTTFVFIFTNPRSGNQQGRRLLDMALSSFRLRDRPEVQVQIYDVTNTENQKEGLHYLHQLQLRQGDRLLKTAFPELFGDNGSQFAYPSPGMHVVTSDREAFYFGSRQQSPAAAAATNASGTKEVDVDVGAWDEWISNASAQLENGLKQYSEEEITERLRKAQESAIKLHVWSAGGDGTVSATIQAMFDNGIDVNRVYFSSIPFGTGNDFADALGWGRSVPGDAVGESMRLLNKIITERLDGYTCKLDIYEITFTTYEDGHIKHVEKDMFKQPGMKRYTCLMIDYFSLGVQGFVGSSFEMHRPGRRSLNILMYTAASAKWVFMKKFPPINEALESISTVPDEMLSDAKLTDADRAKWLEGASERDRKQVMLFRVAGPSKRSRGRKMSWAKEPRARRKATARDFGEGVDENLPVMRMKPIEIDVQNVARFWGRNIDVWNNAQDGDIERMLSSTSGVTNPETWTPQYAGDGKLELFSVKDIGDYALNQMPGRKNYRIGRLAQMVSPLALHFREPENYPPRTSNPLTMHKNIEQGLLYGMCDGEFIELYHPRDIIISRKVTLKAVGKSPETSRIVLDTIKNDGLDAVQMDATAAADKTQSGRPADVSSYVSSPFQRIFRFSRHNSVAGTNASPNSSTPSLGNSNNSAPRSPTVANEKYISRTLSMRRSTINSIRYSKLFRFGRSNTTNIAETSSPVSSPPSRGNLSAVKYTSPLKVRQSLSDLPISTSSAALASNSGTAEGSPSGANASGQLAIKRNVAHRAQSKSLDITEQRRREIKNSSSKLHSLDKNSLASDDYSSSESESESEHTDGYTATGQTIASQTAVHDGSKELNDHCLLTIGKDIVEKARGLQEFDEAKTLPVSPVNHKTAAANHAHPLQIV